MAAALALARIKVAPLVEDQTVASPSAVALI